MTILIRKDEAMHTRAVQIQDERSGQNVWVTLTVKGEDERVTSRIAERFEDWMRNIVDTETRALIFALEQQDERDRVDAPVTG